MKIYITSLLLFITTTLFAQENFYIDNRVILAKVNQCRKEQQLKPLIWNEKYQQLTKAILFRVHQRADSCSSTNAVYLNQEFQRIISEEKYAKLYISYNTAMNMKLEEHIVQQVDSLKSKNYSFISVARDGNKYALVLIGFNVPNKSTITRFNECIVIGKNCECNYTAVDKEKILTILNQYRHTDCAFAKAPNTSLVWDDDLALVAQRHATEMCANNYLAHKALDGSMAFGRVKRAAKKEWNFVGENIGEGQKNEEEIMDAWRNKSEGHCRTMMTPSFKAVGVARSGNTWVMVLGCECRL